MLVLQGDGETDTFGYIVIIVTTSKKLQALFLSRHFNLSGFKFNSLKAISTKTSCISHVSLALYALDHVWCQLKCQTRLPNIVGIVCFLFDGLIFKSRKHIG